MINDDAIMKAGDTGKEREEAQGQLLRQAALEGLISSQADTATEDVSDSRRSKTKRRQRKPTSNPDDFLQAMLREDEAHKEELGLKRCKLDLEARRLDLEERKEERLRADQEKRNEVLTMQLQQMQQVLSMLVNMNNINK